MPNDFTPGLDWFAGVETVEICDNAPSAGC